MKTIISPDGNGSFLRRNLTVPRRETSCSPPGNGLFHGRGTISAGTLATSGEKDAGKVRPERDTNNR